MNIAWWLEHATWDHGDKIGMIDGDEAEWTFSDLNNLSNQMSHVLQDEFDVQEDDVVCTLLPEDHLHVALLFGILKVGAVYCSLNRTQNLEKFKYDVGITKPKVLITYEPFLDVARALLQETDDVKAVVVYKKTDCEFPVLTDLMEQKSDHFRIVPRANDDLAVVNFTAGSTGPSKGVMCSHVGYLTSCLSTVFVFGMKSSDVNINIGYLFHNSGIHSTVVCVIAKTTNIWLGGWDAEKCMAFIEKYKPTYFHLIAPIMIRDMAARPKFQEIDLSGIRMYIAGEPVPADIQKMLNKRGVRTLNCYGMTETMPLGVCLPSMHWGDDKVVAIGSSGKADNKELGIGKIIDVVSGEEITEPNVKGEVLFKGDILTPGYYKDPERTKEAIDRDDWFHTSDLAYKDEEGNLFVGGRTDDIISSGAEKLSLSEIEAIIHNHPNVADAACIGVNHERFGQVAGAFIVTKNDVSEEVLKDEMDKYMSENLEKWKRPRIYFKLDEIPRITAKRSKNLGVLKTIVAHINLKNDWGVICKSELDKK